MAIGSIADGRSYFKEVRVCRVCGSTDLAEVLRIAPQFLATIFVRTNAGHPLANVKIPLTLMLCPDCGLVQLKETVRPDVLYGDYFYRTGINETMRRDLRQLVEETRTLARPGPGDVVIDVGANDCTMIQMFPADLERIAVEPARNIDWSSVDPSVRIVNDFFSAERVLAATNGRRAKVITACAMFYDLDDPNGAARDIKRLLAPDGVCTIQVSHLYATVKDMNFYDICHEHLEYYSLRTLSYLMERNGLMVFDASMNAVNGGSLRVHISHCDGPFRQTRRVSEVLKIENSLRLEDKATYATYASQIDRLARTSRSYLISEVERGGLVIGLGASTKGNVLLQLCGIDKTILPFISERNPNKVGLRTLGTDIELISEEQARALRPSCILVIPWNFKDEIVARERAYLQARGRLLFLMPYPYLLDRSGEHRL